MVALPSLWHRTGSVIARSCVQPKTVLSLGPNRAEPEQIDTEPFLGPIQSDT
jgi:hypothetical protein